MMKRALALIIAIILALPCFVSAEDNALEVGGEVFAAGGEIAAPGGDDLTGGEIAAPGADTEGADEMGSIDLVAPQDDSDDTQEPSPTGEGDEGCEANLTVTWCFIVDWTLYAEQEAKEGEAILCPEAPEAPEGMAFAGWFLENGTQLFIDGDGDGEIDPVIAHVDPLRPEVNVDARFAAQKPSPEG